MTRPTIFISSTIYDFRDMRSALKDYLESRGCRVLASEFNDFEKPLDKHSYQACLDAIEQSELFILMIGARVGGWFDEPNKISITRQEYRHAYELAKKGRIKLLTFVRDDVWNHRQSVKELRKALKADPKISPKKQKKLANHQTTFIDDPESVIAFIDEVSRNKETAAAVRGEGPLPVANWVHTFKGFSDIRQAIDPLILSGLSVSAAAGRKALQTQLLTLLQQSVPVIGGKLLLPDRTILRLAKTLDLQVEDIGKTVRVDKDTWNQFGMLAVLASKPAPEASHLRSVLNSDLLLRYDPKTSTFSETPEYDLLAQLMEHVSALNGPAPPSTAALLQHGHPINPKGDRSVPVDLLAAHLRTMFRLGDVVVSAKALVLALDGRSYSPPERMPRSPFLDQEDALAGEEVSLDQIRDWLGLKPQARRKSP